MPGLFVFGKLFVVFVAADTSGGDGFVDNFLREVVRNRIVMRKLHMIRTASLRYAVEL